MRSGNEKTNRFNYKALKRSDFPILGMKNIQEENLGIGETVYKIINKQFTASSKGF